MFVWNMGREKENKGTASRKGKGRDPVRLGVVEAKNVEYEKMLQAVDKLLKVGR